MVCQLAHRQTPANAIEPRRVEGSGGDGGIEAYWLLSNGKKIGYQAKYWTKTKDISWRQVDESVKQAIDTHPELVEYPSEPDDAVSEWPFEDRDNLVGPELINVEDDNGRKWLTLYSFYMANELNKDDDSSFRRMAFFRVSAIIVDKKDVKYIEKRLNKKQSINPSDTEPLNVIDKPYLHEFPWRATWKGNGENWKHGSINVLKDIYYINPVLCYSWDSQRDTSFPEDIQIYLPSIWLAKELGLKPRPNRLGEFENSAGQLIFINPNDNYKLPRVALINYQAFIKFLEDNRLDCFWIIAGEKKAYTGRDYATNYRRQYGAIYRFSNGKWMERRWHED